MFPNHPIQLVFQEFLLPLSKRAHTVTGGSVWNSLIISKTKGSIIQAIHGCSVWNSTSFIRSINISGCLTCGLRRRYPSQLLGQLKVDLNCLIHTNLSAWNFQTASHFCTQIQTCCYTIYFILTSCTTFLYYYNILIKLCAFVV